MTPDSFTPESVFFHRYSVLELSASAVIWSSSYFSIPATSLTPTCLQWGISTSRTTASDTSDFLEGKISKQSSIVAILFAVDPFKVVVYVWRIFISRIQNSPDVKIRVRSTRPSLLVEIIWPG